MPRTVQAICYVDFHGDLKQTACGLELEGLAGYSGPLTVFMSMATCPGCQAKIQARIAQFDLTSSSTTSARPRAPDRPAAT